jgi:MHS family proline/betaine transporter-like MFS transporter
MAPAYYLMATSVIGAIAIYFLRESARRPLPGSMPSVDTVAEAQELIASQNNNAFLPLDVMPFEKAGPISVP